MIINSAVLKVLGQTQASYELLFIKSNQIISKYRMPRSDLNVGLHELTYSLGTKFPFEADSIKVSAEFVTNENILLVNGEKEIKLPVSGITKTIGFGVSVVTMIMIGVGGFILYRMLKKR